MPHDSRKEAPACVTSAAPRPLELDCPTCGAAVEAWSDEEEARCDACGVMVKTKQ